MDGNHDTERYETVIIGAGQAGLATGYHLARQGRSFVILEADQRVGDVWRRRWDSLHLFTPARHDGLPGWRFPAKAWSFPSRDAMADYLEAYAARFGLPVRTGTPVEQVTGNGDGGYLVTAAGRRFEAGNVVVATGAYQVPTIPAFATQLDPGIVQLHASDYRGPSQLCGGGVLVVGAGNSGAEIALEAAAAAHPVWLSGREVGALPFRIGSLPSRLLLERLALRLLFHRVLTVRTPMGRKMRARMGQHGTPLIRIRPGEITAAGVERVPRVAGIRDGLPLLADGRVLEVANVVWCTGFHHDYSWIALPGLAQGEPPHRRGVVAGQPGLYLVGLHFLYAMSSAMIHGVGRDAAYVARHIAGRMASAQPAGTAGEPGARYAKRIRQMTPATRQ
jgi:putative flavoprotein involved in K+ transport